LLAYNKDEIDVATKEVKKEFFPDEEDVCDVYFTA